MAKNKDIHRLHKKRNRLEHIDFCLFWYNEVSRNDLIEKFYVSAPQATLDLKTYQETAPDNLQYDVQAKRYIPSSTFKPVYYKPDALSYLNHLAEEEDSSEGSDFQESPKAESLPTMYRRIDLPKLQVIVQAMKHGASVALGYQSPFQDKCSIRTIKPLAFVFAQRRWHLRAYCYEKRDFRSFVLGRIQKAGKSEETFPEPPEDSHWNRYVEIRICPSKSLSPSGADSVKEDYKMDDGIVLMRVRRALLKYFLWENDFSEKKSGELGKDITLIADNKVLQIENEGEILEELKILSESRKA